VHETRFYVRLRGRITGPFQQEELRKLFDRGRISRVHELSNDRVNWVSAGELFTTPAPAGISAAAEGLGNTAPIAVANIDNRFPPDNDAATLQSEVSLAEKLSQQWMGNSQRLACVGGISAGGLLLACANVPYDRRGPLHFWWSTSLGSGYSSVCVSSLLCSIFGGLLLALSWILIPRARGWLHIVVGVAVLLLVSWTARLAPFPWTLTVPLLAVLALASVLGASALGRSPVVTRECFRVSYMALAVLLLLVAIASGPVGTWEFWRIWRSATYSPVGLLIAWGFAAVGIACATLAGLLAIKRESRRRVIWAAGGGAAALLVAGAMLGCTAALQSGSSRFAWVQASCIVFTTYAATILLTVGSLELAMAPLTIEGGAEDRRTLR
jgi:hypothetical protein